MNIMYVSIRDAWFCGHIQQMEIFPPKPED
jgi:hypothetical protein